MTVQKYTLMSIFYLVAKYHYAKFCWEKSIIELEQYY